MASRTRQDGRPGVLVTDGEQRCALAACRALAAAGYEVGVASASSPATAMWSRACSERIRVPDPRRDPAAFVERLCNELERTRYDVVLPGADASLLALSAHRERLEPLVRLGMPAHDVVEACLDKELLGRRAQEAGFAQPLTLRCLSKEAGRSAAAELGYPVVVKPLRSFSEAHATEHKPVVADDDRALAAAADELGTPFLVQEFLANAPVVSCGGVAIDGRLLGFVTSRYTRVWPPCRGSAACSDTFAPPPALRAAIRRLVTGLGWSGVFEIELLERSSGPPAVIDFNTRVYGTLALAVRAGCNLPAIWCDYLVRHGFSDTEPASGLRYRWEDGELFSLLRAVARGELRAAARIASDGRDVTWAHYARGDAGPLVARSIFLGRRGIETAAHSVKRSSSQPMALQGRLQASTGGQS